MKILVLEYVTGGGMRQEIIPPSFSREGRQMRNALLADLLAVADVELIVFHDDRLIAPILGPRVETVAISDAETFQAAWQHGIAHCDAVWPIAPETGGILEQLCREVEAAGKPLLTCPAAAVRIAASKLATIRRLQQFGLPVVPTKPFCRSGLQPATDTNRGLKPAPTVIKPDDGAGCENSRIVQNPADSNLENGIIQPLLQGEPLSLSALFAEGQARLLSVNRQIIDQTHGCFTLKACQVNAIADIDGRWQTLATQIAQAMPECWGYAGVDLILTADGPVILEINPRLTTSYAGLREATGENPAALILELLKTGILPPPRHYSGNLVTISLE